MNGDRVKLIAAVFVFLISATLLTSCATSLFQVGSGANLPPVLSEEEITRPYTKLGRIQIAVEIYGPELPNPREWGFRALSEEAEKMGADAVLYPEVTSHPTTYLIIPSNEYRATGLAIKYK